jgi:hypothetical protein
VIRHTGGNVSCISVMNGLQEMHTSPMLVKLEVNTFYVYAYVNVSRLSTCLVHTNFLLFSGS